MERGASDNLALTEPAQDARAGEREEIPHTMRRRASEFTSLKQIAAAGGPGPAGGGPWGALAVFDAWTRATGVPLSRVTRPVEWDGRRLVVEVSDPVWMRNLESMASSILDALNQSLAGAEGRPGKARISALLFRTGGGPPRGGGAE